MKMDDKAAVAWIEDAETFDFGWDEEAKVYLKSRLEELAKLKEQLADSVPRSRYEVACDQYNEAETKRKELFERCRELEG